ncbi:MAG: hypothetical protein WCA32_11705 [Chromatiaceae bacterium]|jgi:hypothetical protein
MVVFSLARGLCSVSAKDVLGKTVSKSRRGALMGWSAGLSGLAVLAVGFVIRRACLLSVALAPPFYVLIAQGRAGGDLLGLGALIVANGLATSLSSPFWGYWSDRSNRQVMAAAGTGAGLLGVFTFLAATLDWGRPILT